MKSKLMPSIVLTTICLVAALLLAVINMFTGPKILKDREARANAAFAEVLPGATGKEQITLTDKYPASVVEGYKFDNGFVFKMKVKGYADGLVIMCGIGTDGKVTGVKHLESKETFGLEGGLNSAYVGDSLDSVELIIASGATSNSMTSKAYYNAIKAALQAAALASGQEVDTRTPEQIIQDSCNAALGTSGAIFTEWFGFQKFDGIDGIYETADNDGLVYAIGKTFIGIKADGTIITTNADATAKTLASNAHTVVTATSDFSDIVIDSSYPASVISGCKSSGGFIFVVTGAGRNGEIRIKVALNNSGAIVNAALVSESESEGYKEKAYDILLGYDGRYTGKTLTTFEPIIASGATMTSNGFADAIKAALQAFAIANGESVDLRTPEQILQDNCNTALGTTEKTFERWFMTEVLTGVDKLYTCDDGIVMILGEKYIGINKDGEIVSTVLADGSTETTSTEDEAIVIAAYNLYKSTLASDYLEETAKPSGAKASVRKIYKTASGNYIFEMRASGNGINGEEWSHPSGEYIYFTVCISAEGKIIDVVTTSQSESKGYGDICATEEYTDQFKGATSDKIVITPEGGSKDSQDLGAIAGSTITSNGYQRSLQQAFAAFKLLTEGGSN